MVSRYRKRLLKFIVVRGVTMDPCPLKSVPAVQYVDGKTTKASHASCPVYSGINRLSWPLPRTHSTSTTIVCRRVGTAAFVVTVDKKVFS